MEASAILKKAIEDYINGDAAAFTTIYNESNRYIYVCVNNVMSGNDNKEDMICDIMQDTYVEISKHINSLQNVNQFLSWAGTIATRKCYEAIKKAGKYTLLNEDESFDSLADDDNIIPEEIMQNKEKQRLLREIIQNELTEMQKLCIVGYFYNEMKQSEIAKELGIPENSVKSHLLRAKAKIKDSVVDLEKNKGTKLYSVAPLLLLLFTDEVKASTVSPVIGQSVLAEVGVSTGQAAAGGVAAASVTGAGTAGVASSAQAATTIGVAAAKTAGAMVGLKAIIIAAAAVVTIGGVAAGVGIAIAKNNQFEEKKPDKVVETTAEESDSESENTEEVTEKTTTEEKLFWQEYEVSAESDNWYSLILCERRIYDNFEEEVVIEVKNIAIDYIYTTTDEIGVVVHEDSDVYTTDMKCEIVNKDTKEIKAQLIQPYEEKEFVFDRNEIDLINDDELENYIIRITFFNDDLIDELKEAVWYDDAITAITFEIPNVEPYDEMKYKLTEAAIYTGAHSGVGFAFSDYNGDGVPELISDYYDGVKLYKYEDGEYIYYMDLKSYVGDSTRVYRDILDGSYVVLEIYRSSDSYTNDGFIYLSQNEVYLVDIDTKERRLLKTIESDDMTYIEERTFYNEDGTTMTGEEFLAMLDSEMSYQYEYLGNLSEGYSDYNGDWNPYISAYNYYLENKFN